MPTMKTTSLMTRLIYTSDLNITKHSHQCCHAEVKGTTQSNPKLYNLRILQKSLNYTEVNLWEKSSDT